MKHFTLTSVLLLLSLGFSFLSLGLALQTFEATVPSRGSVSSLSTFVVVVAADGSGNYTTIQEGINALPSDGGEVHVKDGNYLISSEIVVSVSQAKLMAVGTNVNVYTTTPNLNIIHVKASNVEVSGFHMIGEGSFQTWDGGNGILLDRVEKVTIRDVKVENSGTMGIYLINSNNCTIENADVAKSGKHGVALTSSSYNRVINSTSYENGRFIGSNFMVVAYNGVTSHHNLFQRDVSYNSGDNGFYVDVGCLYNTIKDSKAFNHTTIWGGGGQGILVKASYTFIQNNEIWGCARSGIVLNEGEITDGGASYCNITGNYSHDNEMSGIALVKGHDNYFGWNWVEGSKTRDGIEIQGTNDNNKLEYNTMMSNVRTDLTVESNYNNAANNYYVTLYNGGIANNISPSLSTPPRPHP